MSLDHALLVSLLEKPSSGYTLARRFERSIGHFWHATHQQIYRVLARMENAGWIAGVVQRGENAPDRKVFSVTATGRTALTDWLERPGESEGARSTLMVKLRAAAFADPAQLLPEVRQHHADHAALLAKYRLIAARDFSGALTNQQQLQYQVLKFGLAYEQTWLDWCREAETLIQQLANHHPKETA